MKLNVIFKEDAAIKVGLNGDNSDIPVGFGDAQTISTTDYDVLRNKPSINSVVLEGSLSAEDLGLGRVYYDTKENWDLQVSLIAERSVVYIYSNASYIEDEVGNRTPVADIKIGDGTSYLIDMPFVTQASSSAIIAHLADMDIHTTAEEKAFWNNKVSTFFTAEDPENLTFSKTQYSVDSDILVTG